jgi:hypothetical protein
MYVIMGNHLVLPEGKFILIALVIVRITLNVIVRVSIIQKLVVKLSNTSTTFSQQVKITLSKCLRV